MRERKYQQKYLSPHWGPKDPSGVQSSLYVCQSLCAYFCLSVSMYGCPRRILAIIRANRNCVQHMQPQATGSNPLSGSIICPSVCPSVPTRAFCDFCICINFQCGVQRHDSFSPYWGPEDPSGVQSSLYVHISVYMSVCLSIYLYVSLSAFLRRFLSIEVRRPYLCVANAATGHGFKSPE